MVQTIPGAGAVTGPGAGADGVGGAIGPGAGPDGVTSAIGPGAGAGAGPDAAGVLGNDAIHSTAPAFEVLSVGQELHWELPVPEVKVPGAH